ncbi:FAD dependent oxidoreductase superfamily [Pochonia chlamydosporia 170]|uniref:FAD dependent oxidoreductase superfamily n=1 Tax=Pochonia chlamydosporia 170 TaxID=1380566 RepID=A0A179G8G1_METCM|nr:FAD dependent oxidoreductase superfamily [Pochonia chlamydosporia 170]OAQ73683.1 FAD dependent oxidoreductase superfamily [Pochonia chlamydosporia 170]
MSQAPTIIIIGAGIIGLSTAVRLQQNLKQHANSPRPQILLVAREWPASIPGAPPLHSVDYASMWAGAHVRPIPATTAQLKQEAKWLRQAVMEFDRQATEEPACGVTRTTGVEYLESPDQGYVQQDAASFASETGLSGYRKYSKSELPEGVALGYEYETFCINSPVYCESLLRQFLVQGGKTMKKDLKSEWEAFSLAANVLFVINASGTGFGDPNCFPTRGQTVVTDLLDVKRTVTKQNKDGAWSFLIPRFFNGGTIVGGTKEPGDWRSTPCMRTRQKLLENGLEIEPLAHGDSISTPKKTIDEIGVISDVVGRRPTRQGGMRIEVEKRTVAQHLNGSVNRSVIHAYGAGGRGYEISWGVANEVVTLAVPLLAKSQIVAKL